MSEVIGDNGNLRSSHREMSQLRLKFANTFLHDLVIQFVETRLKDYCIRQRLQADREALIRKGTFYVLENESRAEPGFLIFLPGQPAVFLTTRGVKGRKPPAFTLRMRTDVTLGDGGGTILVASLDKIQHTLRFEDVWVWKGEEIQSQKGYSARREYLKEFVEQSWTPDARLMGGIQCSVANPQPFSTLAAEKCFSVELFPEQAGRRRFYFEIQEVKAAAAAVPPPAPRPVAPPVSVLSPTIRRMNAYATSLESLPDVYDLTTENGETLSRAAVQQIALSQQLRASSAKKNDRIPVVIEWKNEFNRYEIISCR